MYATCASVTYDPESRTNQLGILTDDANMLMAVIEQELDGVVCHEIHRRRLGFRGKRLTYITLVFEKGMMKVARAFPPNDTICRNRKWAGWRTIEKLACK